MKQYPYILTTFGCGMTGLNLRDYINEHLPPGVKKIRYRKEVQKWSPTIRWGSSLPGLVEEVGVINSHDQILLTTNKVALSCLLSEHNIPCITFSKEEPTDYPVVVRKIIRGQGGAGIVIAKSKEEWLPYRGCYWSLFRKFQFELRVHTIEGVVVKVMKKVMVEDGGKEDEYPIRNDMNGYHFAFRDKDKYAKAISLAAEIYKVFPITLVGWDLGYDVKKHEYVVIEGNSAPSLNSLTLPLYANFLLKKIWNVDVVAEGGDNA
jgi:hypothetical protein